MQKKVFGTMPDGTLIYEYLLSNEDCAVRILNYGGIIRTFEVFGCDIAAGFDCFEDYLADDSHQGAIIGRVGNRIRDGRFILNGTVYQLALNCGGVCHLHGGNIGFSRRVWTVEAYDDTSLVLSLISPAGEEGYPGTLRVQVTYSLIGTSLKMEYYAVSDADTPISLTNHCYFNLLGYGNGDILDHLCRVDADEISEYDEYLIPTGSHTPVVDTLYDFRREHRIGDFVGGDFGGYDNNYMLNRSEIKEIAGEKLAFAASVKAGGKQLSVYTDLPCMQLYIGNMLTGIPDMKGGIPKQPHCTVCMETQIEPDSVNHGNGILRKGQTYRTVTVYEVKKA